MAFSLGTSGAKKKICKFTCKHWTDIPTQEYKSIYAEVFLASFSNSKNRKPDECALVKDKYSGKLHSHLKIDK